GIPKDINKLVTRVVSTPMIVLPFRKRTRPIRRMNHGRLHSACVPAESADLGQLGKTRNLYTPTFIFGRVEEKAIQLVVRHYIKDPFDRLGTLKISGNINMEAA